MQTCIILKNSDGDGGSGECPMLNGAHLKKCKYFRWNSFCPYFQQMKENQKPSTNLVIRCLHFVWLWGFNDWEECERPKWIRPGRANFMDSFFYGATTTTTGRTFYYMITGRYGEPTQVPYPVKCYRKLRSHALWELCR